MDTNSRLGGDHGHRGFAGAPRPPKPASVSPGNVDVPVAEQGQTHSGAVWHASSARPTASGMAISRLRKFARRLAVEARNDGDRNP